MEVKNIPSNSGLNWYLRYLHSINFSAPKCAKNCLLHQLLLFAHSCLAKIYGARNINGIKVFHYERSKCSWWQVEIFIMAGWDFHDYRLTFSWWYIVTSAKFGAREEHLTIHLWWATSRHCSHISLLHPSSEGHTTCPFSVVRGALGLLL